MEKTLGGKGTWVKDHLAFARAFLPALGRVHFKLAGAQGSADLATIACALERHRLATGKYPKGLAELAPRFLKQVRHDLITANRSTINSPMMDNSCSTPSAGMKRMTTVNSLSSPLDVARRRRTATGSGGIQQLKAPQDLSDGEC